MRRTIVNQCVRIAALSALTALGVMCVSPSSARADDRAAPPPQDRPAPPHDRLPRSDRPKARSAPQPESFSGTVDAFNMGPRGEPNALLITDASGKIMQVNFPPWMALAIQQAVAVGDSVTLTAAPMRSMPDHAVYGLVSLNAKGKSIQIPRPGDVKSGHAEGTIKQLNYDRDGRVDGAVLISGDFVEIGPAAGRLDLKVGAKLTADGPSQLLPGGQTLVRADTVNGTAVDRPPRRDDGRNALVERRAGEREGERGAGDRGPGDRRPRDARFREGGPGQDGADRGPGDRGLGDDAPGDRSPEDRGPAERGSRDRGPRPDGQGPEDGPPPPPGDDQGPPRRGDRTPPPPDDNQVPTRRGDKAPPPPPQEQQ